MLVWLFLKNMLNLDLYGLMKGSRGVFGELSWANASRDLSDKGKVVYLTAQEITGSVLIRLAKS